MNILSHLQIRELYNFVQNLVEVRKESLKPKEPKQNSKKIAKRNKGIANLVISAKHNVVPKPLINPAINEAIRNELKNQELLDDSDLSQSSSSSGVSLSNNDNALKRLKERTNDIKNDIEDDDNEPITLHVNKRSSMNGQTEGIQNNQESNHKKRFKEKTLVFIGELLIKSQLSEIFSSIKNEESS